MLLTPRLLILASVALVRRSWLAIVFGATVMAASGSMSSIDASAASDPQAGTGVEAGGIRIHGSDPPLQLVAVLHAHTTASSGSEPLSRLATMARDAGVDVVLLTENLGYEFRYAPWPWRFFFEARQSIRGVEHYGIERYLTEVAETQRLNPRPLLLAGAEVPPYYYWTGSITGGDLTLHDMQRNLLVVPAVESPAARQLLEGLPVVGNGNHTAYGVWSLPLLLPALLALAWASPRLHRAGVFSPRSYARPFERIDGDGRYGRRRSPLRQPAVWGYLAVVIIGAVLLYANFPYKAHPITPYDATASRQYFDDLFAYVGERGGLTFWSMPEAVDYQDRSVGPFSVKLSTDPYEGELDATDGYTGFGGVYADTVTAFEPGNSWDRTLLAFQRRERSSPPWMIGESAFHYAGQAGKQLDDIVTVLLVPAPTRKAAFEALASGRSYSLRRSASSSDLRIVEFSAAPVGDTAPDAPLRVARIGDVLEVRANGEFELALRIEDARGGSVPVHVELVSDGIVHRQWEETTPFERRWREALEPGTAASYFRLIVRAPPPAYLVSNPVFVRLLESS